MSEIKFINKVKTIRKFMKYCIDSLNGNGKFASKYTFENRKKDRKKMLYILSGYKPYLWEDVFSRVKKFATEDIDICVVSSGLYDKKLSAICQDNNWSYLSTKRNNICVISNIVIKLFDKAEYIYKMDEDMYVTKDSFEALLNVLKEIENEGKYKVGIVGPWIPLNSYCLYEFLNENNLIEDFSQKFGKYRFGGDIDGERFRVNSGIDTYVWNAIGNIDNYAEQIKAMHKKEYEFCFGRYMIGFILFKREVWEKLGGFSVGIGKGSGTEGDEGQMLTFCFLNSFLVVCASRVVAGHFAYGGNEPSVLALRERHPDYFEIKHK